MNMSKIVLPVAALLLFAGSAVAQTDPEVEHRVMIERQVERENVYADRLRDAEERLEIAAREIAQITQERMPKIANIQRRIEIMTKPRIGITIDGSSESGPVKGVEVKGVTPGTAADEAGLRAGDILTAINGESLSAGNSALANEALLDFMHGIEEGDVVEIDFLRNGNVATVELAPKTASAQVFSWLPDAESLHIAKVPGVPGVLQEFSFEHGFPFAGSVWGRMELVELNEGLGRYFGTDKGLLVVSAPEADGLGLQDGDVIHSIDGREPGDVRHALRILGSYESGEKLKLGIMRDKKKRTLEVEVPTNHRGFNFEVPAVKPVRAPAPPEYVRPHPHNAST